MGHYASEMGERDCLWPGCEKIKDHDGPHTPPDPNPPIANVDRDAINVIVETFSRRSLEPINGKYELVIYDREGLRDSLINYVTQVRRGRVSVNDFSTATLNKWAGPMYGNPDD